jgi:pantetheine-phosphate adenylyltransferase
MTVKKIAVYPGTFDPITRGHLDIIERASDIFDAVIVAVAKNSAKEPLFSESERVDMVRAVVKKYRNVSVDCFHGMLVTYCKSRKATSIVRGLRAISEFEYEFQMALMNRKLAQGVTTVFLMPHEKYTYLNSSIVREVALFGGDVSEFVPPYVGARLKKKIQTLRPVL